MKRLVALLAVVVLLAGCTGGGPIGSESGATGTDDTTGGTASQTTAASPCTEVTQSTENPVRESVTPASFPDRPEELTAETVEAFVREYEQVYKRNAVLSEDTRDVGVSVSVQQVQQIDGGYLVTVDGQYYLNAADVVTRGTATVVHADGPPYTARYFVSDDRVRRTASADYRETPSDPRNGGAFVECW